MHGMVAKAEDNNSFNPRLKPACRQAGRGLQLHIPRSGLQKTHTLHAIVVFPLIESRFYL